MADEEKVESPYCECGACGEAECCPPSKCFRHLITTTCKYWEIYIKESELAFEFAGWVLDTASEDGQISSKDLHRKYSELLEKYFYESNLEKE